MGTLTLQGSTSGQITIAPPAVAGTNTLTLPASTGTLVTSESATVSGNLTFTGTGNRITGDMSNATLANRLAFQTSTTNSNTTIYALPNGTATISNIVAWNNSDPTNAGFCAIGITSADARLQASISGTGTYLPLTLYTSGSERMRIDTSGNVGIGTASPSYRLQISGSFKEVQSAEAATAGNVQGTFAASFQRTSNDTVLNIGYATTPDSWIVSSSYGTTGAYKPLAFATSDTERMRITAAGGVSFGSSGTAYGTSGQYLKSNGDAPPSWATLSASGALLRAAQLITSGTTYTTPANCTLIYCQMIGGGGGGGGTSSGRGGSGGGAGAGQIWITVTGSTTYTIAIGSGGSAGAGSSGSGGTGGNTSITVGATTYSANGGSGGSGIGTGGNGAGGGGGGTSNLGSLGFSGTGGSSGSTSGGTGGIPTGSIYYPGGGVAPGSGDVNGGNASYYGCGGGGGSSGGQQRPGGTGSQGYLLIWEFS